MALIVTRGITESHAVKEVFRGERLTAVQSRAELATAEHGVAVGLHWGKAGLQYQQCLGEANVRTHHNREVAVEGGIHRMRNIGASGVEDFR